MRGGATDAAVPGIGPRGIEALLAGPPLELVDRAQLVIDDGFALRQYGIVGGDERGRQSAVLRAAGRDPGAAWGEAGRMALRDVAGVENLEERPLDGDRVDRAVLEHLERRFG